jgi:hypothetical protein
MAPLTSSASGAEGGRQQASQQLALNEQTGLHSVYQVGSCTCRYGFTRDYGEAPLIHCPISAKGPYGREWQ